MLRDWVLRGERFARRGGLPNKWGQHLVCEPPRTLSRPYRSMYCSVISCSHPFHVICSMETGLCNRVHLAPVPPKCCAYL